MVISHLILKHKLSVTATGRCPIRTLDYIGFTFKDFDNACVVIVDELPKSYNEDNLLRICSWEFRNNPFQKVRIAIVFT